LHRKKLICLSFVIIVLLAPIIPAISFTNDINIKASEKNNFKNISSEESINLSYRSCDYVYVGFIIGFYSDIKFESDRTIIYSDLGLLTVVGIMKVRVGVDKGSYEMTLPVIQLFVKSVSINWNSLHDREFKGILTKHWLFGNLNGATI
jgi:uncharacterized membrane protein YbjE (DUF340 family)